MGMNKTARLVLAGAASAAAGAVAIGAAAYASTGYLIRVALDREQPKLAHLEGARAMIRGYGNCDRFLRHMQHAGEKLRSTPHKQVWLQSYDGKRLCGHWFTVPQPKRVIVAMHGWRSCWSNDFGTISDFWQDNDCNVLFAEQRGQGSSGGEYMGFGMTERYDCLEWVKWVKKRCGNLPIYLAGVSMGATTVLLTAQLGLPEAVCGIMADCGFTSPYAIWKHVAEKNLHLAYSLHSGMAEHLCRSRLRMGPRDCSTVEAMRQCKVPVLFAHGTEDHFVPVEMTYANYAACAAPKRLLIVPGADHGMSHYVEKERYEQAILEFWRTFDRKN